MVKLTVTSVSASTGLPLSVTGLKIHCAMASQAAFCRSLWPETTVVLLTVPSFAIKTCTFTGPLMPAIFASIGYFGGTLFSTTAAVGLPADGGGGGAAGGGGGLVSWRCGGGCGCGTC